MPSIISYNVNGIRAAIKKSFWEWLYAENPDIICLQETKAHTGDLDFTITQPEHYHAFFHAAEKKGYSSVAIFSKEKPLHVEYGCGMSKYDIEGRFLRVDFADFSVMSVYLPSGTSGDERQAFKEECLADFLPYITELRKTIPNLILCGDFNIAHQDIDIHSPKTNKNSSGFLPQEKAWMTDFLATGLTDTFRHLNPNSQAYSWWSYRANARKNNKGWRIDYILTTDTLKDKCLSASILGEAEHSDHCPIKLVLS